MQNKKQSETADDYSAFMGGHNSQAAIEEITLLAQRQLGLELKVEQVEEQLKAAKNELREISEKILPEKMDQLGLPEFRTKDGIFVKIKEEIKASVSVERRNPVNDWLDKNGFGGLIKSEVVTAFGRDEIEEAKKLVDKLKAEGKISELERTVNFQTLQFFVREQLAKGADLPLDLFGVQRMRISKIKVSA
jgi:hypothetical protein